MTIRHGMAAIARWREMKTPRLRLERGTGRGNPSRATQPTAQVDFEQRKTKKHHLLHQITHQQKTVGARHQVTRQHNQLTWSEG